MARVFKKQKLNGSKIYKPWKEWIAGDFIIGKFTGTSIDKYRKTNWHIELIEVSFDDGTELEAGKIFGVNSTGMIDKVMEGVEIGQIVQLDYMGTETLTSGNFEGEEAHVTEVSILTEEEANETTADDLDGL